MSNMNVTGTAPEAAAVTEKELQFAKQQAELKSGEALLKGISREVMEQREKVRSSDKDEEQDHSKDTAEISETRSFLERVYRGSVGLMMSAMAQRQELSSEEIAELREILNKAEEGRRTDE